MMNFFRHSLPRLPMLVILAFCLFTAGRANPDLAWCLDGDGQAEFIPANTEECCPEAMSPPVVAPSAQDCCGDAPCLDISSHPHWQSPRSRILNAKLVFPPPAALAVAPPLFVDSLILIGQFTPPSQPRIPETILLQRTTVLLI